MLKDHFGGKVVRGVALRPAAEKAQTMTYSSRRSFVAGGLAVAASAGVAGCSGGGSTSSTGSGAAAPTADATPSSTPLIASEASEWDKLVGSSFLITTDSGKVSAVLSSLERIADVTRPSTLARHQPFLAKFQTNATLASVGGKTFQVSHATKGSFDLFLNVSSQSSGQGLFTAVLN